jgi:transcriptional regulator with XRE-family HTH domain
MSPRRRPVPLSSAALSALTRMAVAVGVAVRDARTRRGMTLEELSDRAGIARGTAHTIESGRTASLESYARIAAALSLRPDLILADGRKRTPSRDEDFVHAAMGELEARQLRSHAFGLAIDEPYQHYQFAGRADLVAWDLERRAVLHIENRTRLPNIQEAAGSFNAKRAYLARVLADRLNVRNGWLSITHAMVVLWSAECLHALRLRRSTFGALCPDPIEAFETWWAGSPPGSGEHRTLVVVDPITELGRRRRFVGLEAIDRIEPRHRTYGDVAAKLRAAR